MEEIKMYDIQEQLTRVLETHRTGDWDTARSSCAELMANSPEVPDTHFVMGLLVQEHLHQTMMSIPLITHRQLTSQVVL